MYKLANVASTQAYVSVPAAERICATPFQLLLRGRTIEAFPLFGPSKWYYFIIVFRRAATRNVYFPYLCTCYYVHRSEYVLCKLFTPASRTLNGLCCYTPGRDLCGGNVCEIVEGMCSVAHSACGGWCWAVSLLFGVTVAWNAISDIKLPFVWGPGGGVEFRGVFAACFWFSEVVWGFACEWCLRNLTWF